MPNFEFSLTPGLEDYLLAVNKLINEKKAVRLKDISKIVGVSNASATSAISQLVEKGYLKHAPYEYIEITPLGIAYAEEISKRRKVITEFFKIFINLDIAEIEKIVCKIEHYLSSFVYDFENTIEFFRQNKECFNKLTEYLKCYQTSQKEESTNFEKSADSNSNKIELSMAKPGKYRILYFAGHRIELRLKQMGIIAGDEIEVISNQSGQVLIAKDILRIGLGRGAAHHIIIEEVKENSQ